MKRGICQGCGEWTLIGAFVWTCNLKHQCTGKHLFELCPECQTKVQATASASLVVA